MPAPSLRLSLVAVLLLLASCAGHGAASAPSAGASTSSPAAAASASSQPAAAASGSSAAMTSSPSSAPAAAASTTTSAAAPSTAAATSTSSAGDLAATAATGAASSGAAATARPSGAGAGATSSGPASGGTSTAPPSGSASGAGGTTTAASSASASGTATGGSGSAAAPSADWPTFHRDAARSGDDPSSPAFGQVRQAWQSAALDGDVYAEPLLAGGRLLVATEDDSVYSLDPASGAVQWRQHVGEPVAGSSLPCGDIDPSGITGTPVVDPAAGRLYAVAFVQPGRHELIALDLTSGALRYRQPIDPPGADPIVQQQRAALALSGGMVYVAYGGLDGDCGAYHGWVVAAAADSGATKASYMVPVRREGGIWAPSGPAVDAAGNLYVSTGNGEASSVDQHSDAVLKLSPALGVLDWFAPTNWQELDNADADIGSVGPALLPGGLLFQIGKGGTGYLLRSDQLGHLGGQAFAGPVCSGAFGGTAVAAPFVYVSCRNGLVALKLTGATFSVAWRGPAAIGDPPIVAGGMVWAVAGGDRTLRGLGAQTGQALVSLPLPAGDALPHFITPTAAGGAVYVAAARRVAAYRGG